MENNNAFWKEYKIKDSNKDALQSNKNRHTAKNGITS